jgi:hypothetical protein
MPTPPRATRAPRSTPPASEGHAAAAEARGLRWLLTVGAVLMLLVCVIEWSSGVINPWDRFLQPLMAMLLVAYAGALARWPQHTPALRLAAVITFNGYIGATVLVMLFAMPLPLNEYQFFSTMYWLPLGYGTAFIFLRARQAAVVSGAISACCSCRSASRWRARAPATGARSSRRWRRCWQSHRWPTSCCWRPSPRCAPATTAPRPMRS